MKGPVACGGVKTLPDAASVSLGYALNPLFTEDPHLGLFLSPRVPLSLPHFDHLQILLPLTTHPLCTHFPVSSVSHAQSSWTHPVIETLLCITWPFPNPKACDCWGDHYYIPTRHIDILYIVSEWGFIIILSDPFYTWCLWLQAILPILLRLVILYGARHCAEELTLNCVVLFVLQWCKRLTMCPKVSRAMGGRSLLWKQTWKS